MVVICTLVRNMQYFCMLFISPHLFSLAVRCGKFVWNNGGEKIVFCGDLINATAGHKFKFCASAEVVVRVKTKQEVCINLTAPDPCRFKTTSQSASGMHLRSKRFWTPSTNKRSFKKNSWFSSEKETSLFAYSHNPLFIHKYEMFLGVSVPHHLHKVFFRPQSSRKCLSHCWQQQLCFPLPVRLTGFYTSIWHGSAACGVRHTRTKSLSAAAIRFMDACNRTEKELKGKFSWQPFSFLSCFCWKLFYNRENSVLCILWLWSIIKWLFYESFKFSCGWLKCY